MEQRPELKSYLLGDFKNNKHKSISLIDLYTSDFKYYSSLEQKHLIPEEAVRFFRENGNAVKTAANIPTDAFRKLKFELIIDEYLKSRTGTEPLPQHPSAQTKKTSETPAPAEKSSPAEKKTVPPEKHSAPVKLSSSKPVFKERILHCTADYSLLKMIDIKTAAVAKTGKRMIFPRYECPSCKRKFTFLQDYKDLQPITFDGHKYTNITEKPDRERYIAYLKAPHKVMPGSKCYVFGTPKPRVCRTCGNQDLLGTSIEFTTKKGKTSSYNARFCKNCSIYYIPYTSFTDHAAIWSLLNEDELPEIKKALQVKAENKARLKAERRAAKRAQALKEKEEQLKKQQEEKLREQKRLEKERILNERIEQVLRGRLSQREQDKPEQLYPHDNNIRVKDFVVRRTTFKCLHNEHKLQNIDAVINIINKDGEVTQTTVPAGYCPNCNIFFIMESTYQRLKMKGTPVCRVSDEKTYLSGISFMNGMMLAQESVLMQYGYSVSQEEGLTSARRRKILALMIDNEIMTRSDIISYLDFFISQRKSLPRFEKAIEKWESDREFVSEYRSGRYSQYGVSGIYRKY